MNFNCQKILNNKMKLVPSIVISLLIISCKTNSPSSSEKKLEEKIDSISENKIDTNNCRLVILFYSIGNGTEFSISNAFEDSIGSYSLKIGKTIDYKKTAWGPEGETDFCLKLNELTPVERLEFISMARSQLKIAKWVNIFENYPCPVRMRR